MTLSRERAWRTWRTWGAQIWKAKETSENLALVSRVMILDREEATVLMEVKMRQENGHLSPSWATWFRS